MANFLFLLIFTCIILSQISHMEAYSKAGAYFSESSLRVGAYLKEGA